MANNEDEVRKAHPLSKAKPGSPVMVRDEGCVPISPAGRRGATGGPHAVAGNRWTLWGTLCKLFSQERRNVGAELVTWSKDEDKMERIQVSGIQV
jgi:hypothetical protein